MSPDKQISPAARIGWLIIFGAAAILAINMGIRQTFGLYLAPLSLDLGLGRETFALSLGLLNLVWGMFAPVAGGLADRFGAGRVVAVGGLIYASGVMMMAQSTSEAGLIGAGTLIGLGVSCTGFTAVLGAVGRAAPEDKRSMALGLASMGSAIGQFLALPYAHVLIQDFGWAQSLMILALTAAIMAPLGWAVAGRPARSATAATDLSFGDALRQALPNRDFRLLTLGFFVCGFHVAFVAVHLPAFLSDRGFGPEAGTMALMAIGLGNIAGTYLCGLAGQVMEKRLALAWLYLLRSMVFLGFLFLPLTYETAIVYSALLGVLWLGTVPLTSGLVATLFGPKWMSMLFGFVFLSHQVGGFLGAWLGGYMFDIFGSYEAMWWISVILGLMAAALHFAIREAPAPTLKPVTQ